LKVISPPDLNEGRRCVEIVSDEVDAQGIDSIYKMIACTNDYINLTTDGNLSWCSISSCSSDS